MHQAGNRALARREGPGDLGPALGASPPPPLSGSGTLGRSPSQNPGDSLGMRTTCLVGLGGVPEGAWPSGARSCCPESPGASGRGPPWEMEQPVQSSRGCTRARPGTPVGSRRTPGPADALPELALSLLPRPGLWCLVTGQGPGWSRRFSRPRVHPPRRACLRPSQVLQCSLPRGASDSQVRNLSSPPGPSSSPGRLPIISKPQVQFCP